ncbi:MAG TPA: 1,2-phenylacetyl-CoA epoxidase subunit PaaC [Steroidobacteraceae bacterium]
MSTQSAVRPKAATGAASTGNLALVRYVLRLADTSLVLGQRLGEWVGHAPALEEDLGLANLSLDLIGQARLLLTYAGELEGRGRTEDDLAMGRDGSDYFNLTLAEQPNGDFGRTIVRQVLIDAFQLKLYEALQSSSDARLAEVAAKALKETRYHFRYSAGWLVRLGDGTEESHRRVQSALDELWRFTREFFVADDVDGKMTEQGVAPKLADVEAGWNALIDDVLREATLKRPADVPYSWHGKRGEHTEHLGYLLAEMQFLHRAYPGASW